MPTLYDRLGGWYDRLAASERPLIAAGLQRLAPRPGERVLEIGPGPGWALAQLAGAAQPGGYALGLDRSFAMLRAARKRLGGGPPAGLCCGDAARLPLASGGWDALFLSFTLELFPDAALPGVLAECRRVLRPGGRLGVVALQAAARPGMLSRAYSWAHAHFPRAIDCRPIPLAAWLERAGFQVQALEVRSLWGLPVAIAIGS